MARTSAVQQELTRAALAPGAPGDRAGPACPAARRLGAADRRRRDARGGRAAGRRGPRPAELRRRAGPAARRPTRPASAALHAARARRSSCSRWAPAPRIRGFLAVGRPGPFPAADRHVVNAAALAAHPPARAVPGARTAPRPRSGRRCCGCCWPGADAVAEVVDALGDRLPAAPLAGRRRPRAAPSSARPRVDVAADAAARRASPCSRRSSTMRSCVLVGADGADGRPAAGLPERVPGRPSGTRRPVAWAGLAEGVRHARQAAEHGRARGARSRPSPTSRRRGWRAARPERAPARSRRRCWPRWWPRTAPGRRPGRVPARLAGPHGQWEPRPRRARRPPAHAAQADPPGRRSCSAGTSTPPASAPSCGSPCTHRRLTPQASCGGGRSASSGCAGSQVVPSRASRRRRAIADSASSTTRLASAAVMSAWS